MNSNISFQPDWISPPGDTIKDILEERGITLKDFSVSIGLSLTSAKRLLDGSVEIDGLLAGKLVSVLGSSVSFWENRERIYREDIVRVHDLLDERKEWVSKLPTADMTRNGWIEPRRSWKDKAVQCLDFFGIDSVNDWYQQYEKKLLITAFRTSESFDSKPESIVTWLRRGELISQERGASVWNQKKFIDALRFARSLTRTKSPHEFLPQLQDKFEECGVILAIVPTPAGCRASGATFFTKESKAVILLSFRYLADDQFWFTLFHEAGHILLHGQESIFLEGLSSDNDYEEEANKFSEDFLIPDEWKDEFKKLSYKRWRDIPRFARKIGISSGIVVGQLQHKGIIGHHQLNKMKVRYQWDKTSEYSVR